MEKVLKEITDGLLKKVDDLEARVEALEKNKCEKKVIRKVKKK